jgi:DNA-binding PucR family transcriptional regulator
VALAVTGNTDAERLLRVLVETDVSAPPRPVAALPAPEQGAMDVGEGERVGAVMALIPASADRDVAAALRGRLTALEPGFGGDRVAVGVGGRVTASAALADSAAEARLAMRLAAWRSGRVEVVTHGDLGSHMSLLANVPDGVRRDFRDRVLGPILAYEATHHMPLEETLRAFLAHSGSWHECAVALHIHVNTLRYRIARIGELTGRDLTRLDHQVDCYLALRVR